MKLSTLECSVLGCGRELQADLPMWHILESARELGWRVDDEATLCPEHADADAITLGKWVVGCHTCGYEESMLEDEAHYEYREHECEPDTYLTSPAEQFKQRKEIKEHQERRATERAYEEERVRHQAGLALARQQQIENYARSWLRLRNIIIFWKRESIL